MQVTMLLDKDDSDLRRVTAHGAQRPSASCPSIFDRETDPQSATASRAAERARALGVVRRALHAEQRGDRLVRRGAVRAKRARRPTPRRPRASAEPIYTARSRSVPVYAAA